MCFFFKRPKEYNDKIKKSRAISNLSQVKDTLYGDNVEPDWHKDEEIDVGINAKKGQAPSNQ